MPGMYGIIVYTVSNVNDRILIILWVIENVLAIEILIGIQFCVCFEYKFH